MQMKIALVGNQNCGKTTLFNYLTGSSQHVGNFPGVTVDSKTGTVIGHKEMELVDLPGIYSLSPYSNEEIVTRDYIIKQHPDVIINILDATNIERNLYLTLQLMELNVPLVLALNMMDEVVASDNSIDAKELSKLLGVEIVPISAIKHEGIGELLDRVKMVAEKKMLPGVTDFCHSGSAVHRAIHSLMTLIEDHAERAKLPLRFAATRIIEGDEIILNQLELSDNEKDIVNHIVSEMEKDSGLDKEAAFADMRYSFIDELSLKTVKRKNIRTKEQIRSAKIDKILLNKFLAYPIFIVIMALIFFITFGPIGIFLQDLMESGISWFSDTLNSAMTDYGLSNVVRSLISNGILAGIGSVLSFLPIILLLFFFLSLLEDTGYMARVAFLMDKPLRKLGLSGRSFVPLLLGFGCSVPAVMGARTLTSKRDHRLTIMLIPFMSCSAKIAIYSALAVTFFGNVSWLIIISLYLVGVVLAIFVAFISKLLVKGKPVPFVMELPAYRMPGVRTTLVLMTDKAKDFVKKAFTVIFLASLIIWFLQSFDYQLNFISETNQNASLLENIARSISFIFNPLGFGDWRITAAVFTGLSAKEAVRSTLEVLFGNIENMKLVINSLQAYSLLLFLLLYMPCIATFATVKKELHSTLEAFLLMLFQTCVAWLVSCAFYQIGNLICSL